MISLVKLPYAYDALEPYYSAQTLKLHYEILHRKYVENYNKTEEKLENARRSGDYSNIKCLTKDLAFNASGDILHTLFWYNMRPAEPFAISSRLLGQIIRDFDSFETFKKQFEANAMNIEGSGWGILGWVPYYQKLVILQAEKHQDLTIWGIMPILVLDMWEHSYYLQYKTNKEEYINNWWNIVNWEQVAKRFERRLYE